jgi:hypothetical protein
MIKDVIMRDMNERAAGGHYRLRGGDFVRRLGLGGVLVLEFCGLLAGGA